MPHQNESREVAGESPAVERNPLERPGLLVLSGREGDSGIVEGVIETLLSAAAADELEPLGTDRTGAQPGPPRTPGFLPSITSEGQLILLVAWTDHDLEVVIEQLDGRGYLLRIPRGEYLTPNDPAIERSTLVEPRAYVDEQLREAARCGVVPAIGGDMSLDVIRAVVGYENGVALAEVAPRRRGDGAVIDISFFPERVGLRPEDRDAARARLSVVETAGAVTVAVLVRRRDGSSHSDWTEIERFTVDPSGPARPKGDALSVPEEVLRRGVAIARAYLEGGARPDTARAG